MHQNANNLSNDVQVSQQIQPSSLGQNQNGISPAHNNSVASNLGQVNIGSQGNQSISSQVNNNSVARAGHIGGSSSQGSNHQSSVSGHSLNQHQNVGNLSNNNKQNQINVNNIHSSHVPASLNSSNSYSSHSGSVGQQSGPGHNNHNNSNHHQYNNSQSSSLNQNQSHPNNLNNHSGPGNLNGSNGINQHNGQSHLNSHSASHSHNSHSNSNHSVNGQLHSVHNHNGHSHGHTSLNNLNGMVASPHSHGFGHGSVPSRPHYNQTPGGHTNGHGYNSNYHNRYYGHSSQGMVRYDRYKKPREEHNDKAKYYTLTIGSEGKVQNLSPMIWKYTHLTKLVMRENAIRLIPNEICRLKTLLMLDISNNRIKTLPNTMGELLELRELNVANNKLTRLPNSIGRLFNLQSLNIEGNDILIADVAKLVKQKLDSNGNHTQAILEALYMDYINQNYLVADQNMQTSIIPSLEPHRQWVQVPPENQAPQSELSIFVMTYNILSDKYATSQQYGYCPSWALEWNYRKGTILNEILRFEPDIVCLQEIEKRVFTNLGQDSELTKANYKGLYSQKSRAKNMIEQHQDHIDGCAIFYKSETLRGIILGGFSN